MMMTKSSCHTNKRLEPRSSEDDRLSDLPDEILLSIVSSFSMKEIARLSCVSHRWELIWRCAPLLIFEDSRAMEKIDENWAAIAEERPGFVRWVDRVLEKHLGAAIDNLRITFDLDHNWQSHVDKWTTFALDKHVKRLELDFRSCWRRTSISCNGVITPLCGEALDVPPTLNNIKSTSLKSLCLKDVKVSDEFIDHLSHSCPLLEILCIVTSDRLRHVKLSASFKRLKHLEVLFCWNLKKIDISAPKLCSFVFYNTSITELHFSYAHSLTNVSVGKLHGQDHIANVFDSLSEYLSQLAYLSLSIHSSWKLMMNLGINNPADMPNLQHLEFRVTMFNYFPSLRGWAPLIAAAPHLQKLTLKLEVEFADHPPAKLDWSVRKWDGFPLKCLKTLELGGYQGWRIDLELAFFVFENATMLEEVIVDFDPLDYHPVYDTGDDVEERLVKLRTMLPRAVKLTIK